jgi:hypothetical protein
MNRLIKERGKWHHRKTRLGRNIDHDPRSKNYPVDVAGITAYTSVFHRRRVPAFNQGSLGSCHDADTEILTRRGWLPFADLTTHNEVATVDPVTRALIYEHPTRVIRLRHKGEIYAVKNRRHDLRVTAEHAMLVRKWDERTRTLSQDYVFVPMKDIGWYSGLMTGVRYAGVTDQDGTYSLPGLPGYKRASQRDDLRVPLHAWLNFLGVYLAEGTMLESSGNKSGKRVQIAASKTREKAFVRRTLAALGVRPLELSDRFTFHDARIYQRLESLGLKGVYAAEKFVPEFVFDLDAESILALLVGHREGDGSLQRGTWTHYTSSPRLADDLQRLIFLTGGKTGVSVRAPRTSTMRDGRTVRGKHPEYSVRHLTSTNACIERKKDITVEHYDGWVYCAEVPTYHTLVTRRNGKILVAGNCTGNASLGCMATDPFYTTAKLGIYTESEAVKVYEYATQVDGVPGQYPPTDTGSSGLAAAKALQHYGFIKTYTHAFSLDAAIKGLMKSPGITGVHWYSSFDRPDSDGQIRIKTGAYVRGGHEFEVNAVDAVNGRVWCVQSWGPNWGPLSNGRFYMTFKTWGVLLSQQGDVTFFA